jgi:murein DD-endopeptidase MepM/ murein hydrolase activator NlpD
MKKFYFLLAGIAIGFGAFQLAQYKNIAFTPPVEVASEPPPEIDYPNIIPPKSSLYNVLRELNVSSQEIHKIVTATKSTLDLSNLRAGTQFRLMHLTDPASELTGIEFLISPVERIQINKVGETWDAKRLTETVETKVVTFRGVVESTLWASAEAAHMDPNLIVQLSEIFAWQVDFAREVRVNDRWRIVIEQKLVHGKPIGWGSILAAEFQNEGQLYTGVLFQTGPEQFGYYAADGSSLRRMFLKSPIRFGRVTSGFSMHRFHPIFKIMRPHLGVDYGAPTGTPIRSVGSGSVIFAGWGGGGGNMVKIRHNSTYSTHYLHMSRIEKGIHVGAHVQQAQVIGFVGMTGAATGPHLHFEFVENGHVVNPLGKKFPSAEPVAQNLMAQFKLDSQKLMNQLPSWDGLMPIVLGVSSALSKAPFPQAHGHVVE